MPYDPALSSDVDRIRLALGDVDNDSLWLPDETYAALLSDAADDLTAATRAAAAALYSLIAMDPVKRTNNNGEAVDYSGRLPRLKALADGTAALPGVITAATSPFTLVAAVFRDTSSNDEYSR